MAITDSLSDIWHALEDKAWGLADFLEDKGVPISTFCESKGVSPLILFAGIIIAILLILMLVSGGGGVSGNAVLTLTIKDEAGTPVPNLGIKVNYADQERGKNTGQNGVVQIDKLPFTKVLVTVSSTKYSGQWEIQIDKEQVSQTVTVTTKKGTLKVSVKDATGAFTKTGTIDVFDLTGKNMGSQPINGAESYDFQLPVGRYKVSIKSVSGAELKYETYEVKEGAATEASFTVTEAEANSASVRVVVQDDNSNAVKDAYVILYNLRGEAQLGTGTTDASGQVTFGNIAAGTSVYPVVYVPNDRRFGQVNAYDAKNLYSRTVQSTLEIIQVKLPLNGRVEVTVWDKQTYAKLIGAKVTIKSKSGEVLSPEKATDSEGKAVFVGFEENQEVYPFVQKDGYLNYERAEQDTRPISYSSTGNKFQVLMERDGSFISSKITVNVTDSVYGEQLKGVNAVLSQSDGTFVRALSNSDNISFEADANKKYSVAVHKPGYLRQVLQDLGPGTQKAQLVVSNGDNAGHVKVCTFTNVNGAPTATASSVDIFLDNGALIDRKDTKGGSDGDNCVTFQDMPKDWRVFAKATATGLQPVESPITDVKPLNQGVTAINLTFGSAIVANAAVPGEIKVCVSDQTNTAISGAEVLLYDEEMNSPSWTGDYRLTTASDGCALFRQIPSVKTNGNGATVAVKVYAIVSASGYATYNGKADGNIIEVQASRTTPMNVRMTVGQSICVNVKNNGQPVADASVSLCANAPCTQILETKTVESDGHVIFSTVVSSVTVKAVVNVDSIVKETIKSFSFNEVAYPTCGDVDVQTVTEYATVTFDGIAGTTMEVEPNVAAEIEFILRVNGQPATGGAINTGGQNKVLANSTEVLIELTGDITPGTLRTVDAATGKYAMPFIAPSTEGDYQVTLTASVPTCTTCQGDSRMLTIRVGDGDSDNDGVLDEDDLCPNTLAGESVDSTGCPVASSTDTDGDGIPDSVDQCPGTASGVQVDSTGCPIATTLDSDGDGYPDSVDAYPHDPTRWQTSVDSDSNGIPDQYQALTQTQLQQSSIQICVIDELHQPVNQFSVMLYSRNNPTYSSAPSGGATYGSNYGGYRSGAYDPRYGSYGSRPDVVYNQPWQMTYSQTGSNCRFYAGYGSFSGLYVDSFVSSFMLKVNADGYEPYESTTGGKTGLSLTMGGPGGIFRLDVTLKKKPTTKLGPGGGGTVTDPARGAELKSASWKQADVQNRALTLYPLITMNERNVNVRINYTLGTAAAENLEYSVTYKVSGGGRCFDIPDSGSPTGTRTVSFQKGWTTVDDEVTLYSKDECWSGNKPEMENEGITLTMEGQLIQIGDREATVQTKFTPVSITLKPLIGATKKIKDVSDLAQLNGMMALSNGVVTKGRVPYCILSTANTDKGKANSGDPAYRTALDKKIYIEFKGESSNLQSFADLVTKIKEYINVKIGKSPVDCEVYITMQNKYMGYIEVGQKGTACNDARAKKDAKDVQPWEKLFCDTTESGMQDRVALGGAYSMKVDSK